MEDQIKKEPESDDYVDALITLASAALERDSMPLPKKEDPTVPDESSPPPPPLPPRSLLPRSLLPPSSSSSGTPSPIEVMEPPWCDVGIVKGTTFLVNSFYHANATNDHSHTSADGLPDYRNFCKIELLPGTAYKFRIAAINACGRGEWSDVSAFKTCLPGYPGAPCSIKISRSAEGARLQWEPPTLCSGRIEEYSVCLAVKSNTPATAAAAAANISLKDLPFKRVYCGSQNHAFVDNSCLKVAYIDKATKPAIIFRIAAKNEKGYGPATQVRWLQDIPASPAKSGDEHSKKDASKKNKMSKLRL